MAPACAVLMLLLGSTDLTSYAAASDGQLANTSCEMNDLDRGGPPVPPAAERQPLQRYSYQFVAMGMKYSIIVYGPDIATVEPAIQAAEHRVRDLDRVMSDYHTESELSKLCDNSGPGKPVKVSPDLFTVLEHSQEIARETRGAFDITIGPVIQLWRTARRNKTLPPPQYLTQALSRIGHQSLVLNELDQTVELQKTDMSLDLGGIAAGYACDEVLKILKAYQLPRALIEASGDLLAGDPPPGREGWRVSVAGVDGQVPDESQFVTIANASVTTSGDARQYVEIDGIRYSHIVDPKTGLGLTRRSSTTVIAPTGWQADAYATAANLLGTDAGLQWIERHPGCSAQIIEIHDGKEVRRSTHNFPRQALP